jgi:ATP-binding cassette subfamily F protein uup
MNFISVDNISKSFSEKLLFQNLTLGISQGDKAAIVGINGCGKSTLLSLIAGDIPVDSGNISIRKGIRIGYLNQQPNLPEEFTVWQAIFDTQNPVLQAFANYEAALSSENPNDLADAAEQMDNLGAWDIENEVEQVLGKLGIADRNKKIGQMSGGQRKRVALAKLLLDKPDLIILDEPTNHLDLDTIEWLENMLNTANQTLLLITHDRYFLDKVTNVIFELEGGNLYRYNGNYGYYLEKKQERVESKQSEVEKARNLMKREYEWIKRQPKARGTKAKYRVDAFEDIKEKATQNISTSNLDINVGMARSGNKIMELHNISKNYDSQVLLHKFDYLFKKQDKVGIVGKNGVGKSTFLNILTGNLAPDKGSISKGDNTVIGYYTQGEIKLAPDKKVIDVVKDVAEVITTGTGETISASVLLTHFEFPPATQYSPVYKLSGGEKRRLQLLQVLIKNPNFLILDEPTNDFDIKTLNILEDYLLGFKGVLVLVSHDRYFMDRLVDHLFVFEGNGVIRDFPGNYTDYREVLAQENAKIADEKRNSTIAPQTITKTVVAQTTEKSTEKNKAKLSFKEKQEYEKLENEIAKLEAEKTQLTEKLSSGVLTDYTEIAKVSTRIEEITKEVDTKTMRWLELAELV